MDLASAAQMADPLEVGWVVQKADAMGNLKAVLWADLLVDLLVGLSDNLTVERMAEKMVVSE